MPEPLTPAQEAQLRQIPGPLSAACEMSLWATLDDARAERDAADALIKRQGDLLTAAAVALRGPQTDTSWSHHDIAERIEDLKAERDAAEQERDKVDALRLALEAECEAWRAADRAEQGDTTSKAGYQKWVLLVDDARRLRDENEQEGR
jgi:hypothetical protein